MGEWGSVLKSSSIWGYQRVPLGDLRMVLPISSCKAIKSKSYGLGQYGGGAGASPSELSFAGRGGKARSPRAASAPEVVPAPWRVHVVMLSSWR